MKKFNLFAILFAITSVLFFAGCDNDNDKKDGDVTPPAETCFCDEAKTAQCPDGDKAKCETPDAAHHHTGGTIATNVARMLQERGFTFLQ